ncbi:cation diffusion facilitator family transporter [uncultured Sphingomonas sp.]|uniref:cation diffusion facilitator family transporter n=1 Tax=uncultured Sphingomonas sp. TaxID=158754 RepID=UPI0035C9F3A2
MHAPHDHQDHAGHSHAPVTFDQAFAIGVGLNLAYVIGEAIAGLIVHSVALLADAGHNLGDVLGLLVAWGGAALARREPSKRFTYGLKSSTILAALLNALLLLVALGAILLEAGNRIAVPTPVDGWAVSAVAAGGIAVNAATAMLFAHGRRGDLNVRAAFLHMAGDAVVSAGVVVSGLVIWATGASWLDPVTSIVIVVLIFWQTWGLLRETVEMSLDAVPRGIDYDRVAAALAALPDVTATHDLHIWPMSTTETVLTAHLVMAAEPDAGFLAAAQEMLRKRFGIRHSTLQIEHEDCAQDC